MDVINTRWSIWLVGFFQMCFECVSSLDLSCNVIRERETILVTKMIFGKHTCTMRGGGVGGGDVGVKEEETSNIAGEGGGASLSSSPHVHFAVHARVPNRIFVVIILDGRVISDLDHNLALG